MTTTINIVLIWISTIGFYKYMRKSVRYIEKADALWYKKKTDENIEKFYAYNREARRCSRIAIIFAILGLILTIALVL